jgi:hypothetical protein
MESCAGELGTFNLKRPTYNRYGGIARSVADLSAKSVLQP